MKRYPDWNWSSIFAGTLATGGAITLTGCLAIAFSGSLALAQNLRIVPDNTLVADPSRVTPTPIKGLPSDQIDGGVIRGTNLFHSFQEFNINEGRGVYFTNPPGIENILSRVTGPHRSIIQGTLGVLGNANLFLLNPNGILFGGKAQLDLQGSFVATTASGIKFLDGGEFWITTKLEPDNGLLRLNPSALFFNQTPVGAIENQSKAGLQVNPGHNLFLVGGNVTLKDGGTVRAPGGRIELGGLAEAGVVDIKDFTSDRSNTTLNFPGVGLEFHEDVARADVVLTNGAIADVTWENGGDIAINARNISLSGLAPSNICAGIGSNIDCGGVPGQSAGTSTSRAGNIILNATGDVKLSALSRIANNVNEKATGNSIDIFKAVNEAIKTGDPSVIFGSVFITANSLSVTEGASVSTSTFGTGNAGLVYIDAKNSVSLAGSSDLSQSRLASAVGLSTAHGNAGGIFIQTGSLSLTDHALINSSTFGQGRAGAVIVEADGAVSLANDSVIFNNVEAGGHGASGVIDITAKSLSLTNGSQLQTIVREAENGLPAGIGSAGTINITTSDTVTISGFGNPAFGNQGVALPSAIFSRTGSEVSGDAGNIQINTRSVSLSDGGKIDTSLGGVGVAGSIFIDATDSVSLSNNARIESVIEQGATQNTGSSNPFAGGIIDALLGKGGDVTGTILIRTGTLSLTDGAVLNTSTYGNGNAGAVVVAARDDVSLKGGAIGSVVGEQAMGDAGAILMSVGSLSIASTSDYNSGLTTETFGQGNAGLIYVEADKDISIRGNESGTESGIASRVSEGSTYNSGAIILNARSLFLRDEGAKVTVNNQGSGVAGGIEITMREDIILRDKGEISATAYSGSGAEVYLTSGDFLVLVSGSKVTTQAGQNTNFGDGGNVFIDTRYVIAAPFNDNNIDANAFLGSGGNIRVNASRLYDIEKREVASLQSNDITASSDYGPPGQVGTSPLNADPTQGLANLPANPVDPTTLIAETCAPRGGITERQKNQFIVTGRGGLPPDPNAAFPGEAGVNDLGTPEGGETNSTNDPSSTNPASPTPTATPSPQKPKVDPPNSANPASSAPTATTSPQKPEIVEAQGWVYGKNGDIIFTAQSPTITPNNPVLTPTSTCNVSSLLPQ